MTAPRALIFDMDGVLIDSEPLWHVAEIAAFADVGLELTDEDCLLTTGLRIDASVAYWCERHPRLAPLHGRIVASILDRLVALVHERGARKPGVAEALGFARGRGLRLAVASSSPYRVLHAALRALDLSAAFEVVHSAEEEQRGKPDPAVYLSAAGKLGVDPAGCVAVEDSPYGLLSAKAAGMRCIAVPEPALLADPRFRQADAVVGSLAEIGPELWDRMH